MASIEWSNQAIRDLESIALYIGPDASRATAVFIQSIYASVDRLASFPNAGRTVPEYGRDDIRELIVGSYRVIHVVREDQVAILTIHHGARRLRDVEGP